MECFWNVGILNMTFFDHFNKILLFIFFLPKYYITCSEISSKSLYNSCINYLQVRKSHLVCKLWIVEPYCQEQNADFFYFKIGLHKNMLYRKAYYSS